MAFKSPLDGCIKFVLDRNHSLHSFHSLCLFCCFGFFFFFFGGPWFCDDGSLVNVLLFFDSHFVRSMQCDMTLETRTKSLFLSSQPTFSCVFLPVLC